MPSLELVEAVVASAGGDGPGVEVCVLVEGNDKARVPVAEYVTTATAVMAADEVAEVALAGRVVADS